MIKLKRNKLLSAYIVQYRLYERWDEHHCPQIRTSSKPDGFFQTNEMDYIRGNDVFTIIVTVDAREQIRIREKRKRQRGSEQSFRLTIRLDL